MLLSKRRLRWAAVALLLASSLLLIQPTRVWLQNLWIAGALGPQFTVGDVLYHSQNSIVEVRDLSWQVARLQGPPAPVSAGPAREGCTVNVARCWLGVDRQSLVMGRIHLPKVILQDAVVTLASSFPKSSAILEGWQQSLAEQLASSHWENLQPHVSSLTAAENIEAAWSQRVQELVEHSQSILTEAGRIEGEAAAMDNPLRFEDSIRARLTRYRELAGEQRDLVAQLESMESEVASATQRLNQMHAQDVETLDDLQVQRNGLASTDGPPNLEKQLALAIGEASWGQVAPYGEVVANTSHAAAVLRTAAYDVTVRPGVLAEEQVHCSDLKVSGEFRFAQSRSPFHTSGSWRVAQQSPGVVFRQLRSLTTFDCLQSHLEVAASHDSRITSGIQLRIRMLCQDTGSKSSSASPIGEPTVNSLAPVTADLTIESASLSGQLRVAAEALPLLASRFPNDLLTSLQQSAAAHASRDQPLQFELGGTWQQPELKFVGVPPAWLQQAVQGVLERQLQQSIAQSQKKLDTEFKQRVEEMQDRVSLAVYSAQALVAQHESGVLTSQQRVQQQFDESNGSEFARRGGQLQR